MRLFASLFDPCLHFIEPKFLLAYLAGYRIFLRENPKVREASKASNGTKVQNVLGFRQDFKNFGIIGIYNFFLFLGHWDIL